MRFARRALTCFLCVFVPLWWILLALIERPRRIKSAPARRSTPQVANHAPWATITAER
jgi:hypothetical protein